MNVKIIVDSTADLKPQLRQRLGIVPLTVHFGQEEYLDGITITHKQFYEKLVESDTLPTTSQAAPAVFQEAFEAAARAGLEVVVLTVSSELSGTYQSAVIAAEGFEHVHVVDSRTVAIGTGILAELALSLADRGLDAKAIAETLIREREKVQVIAMLDTLEYLKKGGRISKTAAIAGGILNLKPVIAIEDGRIVTLGKARGSRQGNNLLVQQIHKAGGVDFEKPVLLGYTGLSDALLQKYIADSAALWENARKALTTTIIGSVIGTHAGPGAVAVAFFKK